MYIYIRAMSEYQSKIYDNITSKVGQIDRHIIRLVLYPHAQEVLHWKTEVMSFLCDIDKQKNTKKYPKKSFILKALQIKNDMLDALRYQVEHTETELSPIDVSNEQILDAVTEYQNWLATELSTRGVILPTEAYKVLSKVTGCD